MKYFDMAIIKINHRSHSDVALPIFANVIGVGRNSHKLTSSRLPILIKAQKNSIRMKCPGTRIKSFANRVPKIKKRALKRKHFPVTAQEPELQQPEPQELLSNVLITAVIFGILAFGFLNSDYGKSILPEGLSSIVELFYKIANMCIAFVEGFTAKFKEPDEIKPTWSLMISNAFGWLADPPQNQGGFLNNVWKWCAALFANTTAPATPEVPENPGMWQFIRDWLN